MWTDRGQIRSFSIQMIVVTPKQNSWNCLIYEMVNNDHPKPQKNNDKTNHVYIIPLIKFSDADMAWLKAKDSNLWILEVILSFVLFLEIWTLIIEN